jgi:hypothetical protein
MYSIDMDQNYIQTITFAVDFSIPNFIRIHSIVPEIKHMDGYIRLPIMHSFNALCVKTAEKG